MSSLLYLIIGIIILFVLPSKVPSKHIFLMKIVDSVFAVIAIFILIFNYSFAQENGLLYFFNLMLPVVVVQITDLAKNRTLPNTQYSSVEDRRLFTINWIKNILVTLSYIPVVQLLAAPLFLAYYGVYSIIFSYTMKSKLNKEVGYSLSLMNYVSIGVVLTLGLWIGVGVLVFMPLV